MAMAILLRSALPEFFNIEQKGRPSAALFISGRE